MPVCLWTKRGAYWINVHGSGFGRTGVADLIACYRGRFLAIECKHDNGRGVLSKRQEYELKKAANAGALTLVCDDVRQLRTMLDALDEVEG